MTPKRRDLMFSVMDGHEDVLPYLHIIDRFKRCDEILTWLIRHNLTGKAFLSWAGHMFLRKNIHIMDIPKWVLGKIDKAKFVKGEPTYETGRIN